jgi:hypothetical protein
MRGQPNVTFMGETRNSNTVVVVKFEGRHLLKSPNVDEKIILKTILKKADRFMAWRRSFSIRTGGRHL